MYTKLKVQNEFNFIISEEFIVFIGVKQGNAFPLVLFNLELESAFKEILESKPLGLNIGQVKQIIQVIYVNNIVMISELENKH